MVFSVFSLQGVREPGSPALVPGPAPRRALGGPLEVSWDYAQWKQEREQIDQARLARHRDAQGDWRRPWDLDKAKPTWVAGPGSCWVDMLWGCVRLTVDASWRAAGTLPRVVRICLGPPVGPWAKGSVQVPGFPSFLGPPSPCCP